MAKIVHSDAAPAEKVHYTFAGVEFDLGGSAKKDQAFDSDDPTVLASAEVHPWLTVERDPSDFVEGDYVQLLDPKDDVLSSLNSVANDPEAARRAKEAAGEDVPQPVAIEAGLNQSEPVVEAGVAETTAAAADTTDTKKDKS